MVEPHQGIAALTSVYLANSTMEQQQGIRTNLFPPPTHPQPPSQKIPLQQPFQLQDPAPPPANVKQAVTPLEQWGANLRSLLQICNSITAAQLL